MKKLTRQRKPGTIDDALLIQWRAIKAAETALYSAADEPTVLRSVHAITQATTGYAKLLEAHQLEEHVAAIEGAVGTGTPTPARSYGAAYA